MHDAREALLAVLRPARQRLRAARALAWSWAGAHLGLIALVAFVWVQWFQGRPLTPSWLWAFSLLPATVGAVLGALWPVSAMEAARRLDAAGALRSGLATAVEGVLGPVVPLPQGVSRSGGDAAFMEAAVRQALAAGRTVDPSVAVPWWRPRTSWKLLSLLVVLAVPWLWPSPFARSTSPAVRPSPERVPAAGADRTVLAAEEWEAFDAEGRELVQEIEGPALRELAEAYERLLEQLARGEVDRAEALRQLDALSRRVSEGPAAEADELEEALRRLQEALRAPGPLREVSDALSRGDPAAAAEALRRVADRLDRGALDRRALRRLRERLRRLAEQERQLRAAQASNERARERLLRERERDTAPRGARERRLLRRRERRLQRLQRERARLDAARRTLQRLRREAARGVEALDRGDRGEAAEALRRGAEDLDRAGSMARARSQREALRRLLRTLREAVQRYRERDGARGRREGRRGRLRRFSLRAGGRRGGEGARLLLPGGNRPGRRAGGGSGRSGGAREGAGEGLDEGRRDGNGRRAGERAVTLGGGGEPAGLLEVPGAGRQGGEGVRPGGAAAGDEVARGRLERASPRMGQHRDVHVRGAQGRGPTRARTIAAAADQGFVSRDYRAVYETYRDHAERVLEREEVPPGHRFYVRRYFLLIRPRSGGAARPRSEEP